MKQEIHSCACSFGRAVKDNDPTHFPRIGMADNVIYRGRFIIMHTETGRTAIISRTGEGPLHAEAAPCCFDYFDGGIAELEDKK